MGAWPCFIDSSLIEIWRLRYRNLEIALPFNNTLSRDIIVNILNSHRDYLQNGIYAVSLPPHLLRLPRCLPSHNAEKGKQIVHLHLRDSRHHPASFIPRWSSSQAGSLWSWLYIVALLGRYPHYTSHQSFRHPWFRKRSIRAELRLLSRSSLHPLLLARSRSQSRCCF